MGALRKFRNKLRIVGKMLLAALVNKYDIVREKSRGLNQWGLGGPQHLRKAALGLVPGLGSSPTAWAPGTSFPTISELVPKS